MKFQLVVTVLLVGSMLVPSLATPVHPDRHDHDEHPYRDDHDEHPYRDDHDEHEEGKAKAVLQVIRMLLASENHGRGELQQAENATTAPAPASANGECQVQDSDKVDCGYYGITETECGDNECCWQESDVSGVPYCFQKIATAPQCQTNDRVECGYFGINKVDCDSRGCCYSPTTAGGQPWCYHETATEAECQTDAANRVECGYFGITAQQCKDSGCCWSPTSVSDAPWCFTKSSSDSEVARFNYFGNKHYYRRS